MKLLWVIKTPASQWKSANYNFKFSLFSAPFSCFLPLPTERCCCYFFPPFLYPKQRRQLWKCIVVRATQNHSWETRIITGKKNPQTSVPSEVNPGPALAHWIPQKPQSGPYRSGFLGGGHTAPASPWLNLPHRRINKQHGGPHAKVKQALQSSMNVGGSH